jgi:hypothetical protein
MPAIGTTTLPELKAALRDHEPLLSLSEIHALFLGALTSTSTAVRPQALLPVIFGDDPFATAKEPPMTPIMALFGYWNHLASEQEAGRVGLAPRQLPEKPTAEALNDHARARLGELSWYIRGIDAGGDDPSAFGPEGEAIIKRVAEASGILEVVIALFEEDRGHDPESLAHLATNLARIDGALEGLLADLMEIGNNVRLAALRSMRHGQDQGTAAGPATARSPKITRNAPCPCGSGKKYKKCCWLAQPQMLN